MIRNWLFYGPFILGDESYGINISNEQIYKSYMLNDGVFGGEVEIQAFVQIYNVQVLVCRSDGYVVDFGKNCSNGKLTLLLSGAIDSSHYDVIENSNLQF